MIEVELYTTDGRYVVTVLVPDFSKPADVIVWGSRVFRADADLERHYREVFCYIVPPFPGSAEVRR